MHWLFTIVLLVVTIGQRTTDAYSVLVSLYSYCIQAFFSLLLSIGILYLRFSSRSNWKAKAKGFLPFFSVLAATVYAIGNLFPLVALWVPPNGEYARTTIAKLDWFITPSTCISILGFGLLWWVSFVFIARVMEKRNGTVFTVEKVPDLRRDPPGGPVVQIHESVFLSWTAKEALGSDYEVPAMSISLTKERT